MPLRTVRPVHRLAFLLTCALGVSACSDDGAGQSDGAETTAPTGSSFVEGECPVDVDRDVEVRCGTIAVPLDHDQPDSDTIDLAVAVLPAVEAAPDDATPVMVLGGGPGEHTLEPLLDVLSSEAPLVALTADRDVVLLDQRGMGASEPALECPEYVAAVSAITETPQIRDAAVEGFTACHRRLTEDGIDLSAFDTAANVRDLDVVRRALGYEQVSLFGTSYGARLALQAVRAFPDSIESATLSSPVPAEANFLLGAAASFDRAIAAVDAACSADAACASTYPDVGDTVQQLVERLDAQPVWVGIMAADGSTVTVAVDGATVATILFGMFYAPDGPASFPYLVAALGDADPVVLSALLSQPAAAAVSYGAQLSFFCAEEAQQRPDFEPGALGVGQRLVDTNPIAGSMLWDLCAIWDVEPADPQTFEPVDTDVPLLVVTGQFDQITPPSYGETVAGAASNAWYVEVAGVGHSPLFATGPCGVAVLAAFVAAPQDEPDLSCLSEAPRFLLPEDLEPAAAGADGE